MTILTFFHDASSVLTVVSLLTFLGIVFWAYSPRRSSAFDAAANLPFADEAEPSTTQATENNHG